MYVLLQDLLKKNENEIENELDFLFIFIHSFICYEFKNEKIKKIIQLAQDGSGKYSINYSIKSYSMDLKIKKNNSIMKIRSTNRNTNLFKDIDIEINVYVQKEMDSTFKFKNLVQLSPILFEFVTGEKLDMNDDPRSSTSTGLQPLLPPFAPVQQQHHLSSPCYVEIPTTNSFIGRAASHQEAPIPSSLMPNDSFSMGQPAKQIRQHQTGTKHHHASSGNGNDSEPQPYL